MTVRKGAQESTANTCGTGWDYNPVPHSHFTRGSALRNGGEHVENAAEIQKAQEQLQGLIHMTRATDIKKTSLLELN